jgi:hypothetical protein
LTDFLIWTPDLQLNGLCRIRILDPGLLLGDQALHELGPYTSRFVLHFSQMAWHGFSLPYGLSHLKRQFAEIVAMV